MIKINFDTVLEGMSKPEHTTVRIVGNRVFIQYSVPRKAEETVKKMKQDGRTNVMFSRGVMLQWFAGKTEEEIKEIMLKDIDNGVMVAEGVAKKKPEIKNLIVQ
jgi:hypothetical protein